MTPQHRRAQLRAQDARTQQIIGWFLVILGLFSGILMAEHLTQLGILPWLWSLL
jgi:hypothetical protein